MGSDLFCSGTSFVVPACMCVAGLVSYMYVKVVGEIGPDLRGAAGVCQNSDKSV